MKTRITISMPFELSEDLNQYAKNTCRSKSATVTRALELYFQYLAKSQEVA